MDPQPPPDASLDCELLRAYAERGDEAAFAELVRRHTDLVYAAARRQLAGDHHRAQEVAQRVFVELARRAGALSRHPAPLAWLHQRTRWEASHLREAEARRRAREAAAGHDPAMNTSPDDPAPDWDKLAPLLDEAVAGLGERDRAAIFLRHFERRSHAEVARALGVSEAAAQMRAARALDKLRAALARRGLVSSAAALAAVLAAQAAPPAPAMVAPAVLQGVTAAEAAGALSGGSAGFGIFTAMQIYKLVGLGLGVVVLAGGYVWWTSAPPPVAAPVISAPAPVVEPAPAPEPMVKEPASLDDWTGQFRKFFGLPKAELRRRLAAMGFPLLDRTLDRILKNDDPERFAASLLEQLCLFHPDRLLAHAVNHGTDSVGAMVVIQMIGKAWRATRLESWTPHAASLAMLRKTYADDAEFMAELNRAHRAYGNLLDMDPVARATQALQLPAEERLEALIRLALDWPPERAQEMVAWGQAHLQGKEREDFFSRLSYAGYLSADPELAAEIFAALDDAELRGFAAPGVAATLLQYDRVESALAILSSLEGKARADTARMIGMHWMLRDPDGATEWINSIKAAPEFAAAVAGAFEHMRFDSQLATLREVRPEVAGEELERSLAHGVYRTGSYIDPRAGAVLIDTYLETRSIGPISRSMAEKYEPGKTVWTPSTTMYRAIVNTVRGFNDAGDPQGGLTFVNGLTFADEAEYLDVARTPVGAWAEKDRPAAERWVQSAPNLSPEAKQDLLNVVRSAK